MSTAETRRAYRGPAIFSFGFRPFFLGASLWAALSVTVWIASLALGHVDIGGRPGPDWHQDEMLFGFLPAVIAGFLLTAIPNWTGRLPVAGAPLAILLGVWAAGRAVNLVASGPVAAALDVSFLFLFAALAWREVIAGRNARNLPVCIMVSLLALAHAAFHASEALPVLGDAPQRAAMAAAAGLIALIGGRIVPSFTRNWLTARGARTSVSATPDLLDKSALALTGAALAGWVIAPHQPAIGAALLAAGLATLVRLPRWRGFAAASEALVWSLHAGYAWLGLGLCAVGLSILLPAAIPPSAGLHALSAGAVGAMVMAVMTRASLGHTGRALTADRPTVILYVLVNLAAATRVAAPLIPDALLPLLIVSAALWILAFSGFALLYGPLLCAPRAPRVAAAA